LSKLKPELNDFEDVTKMDKKMVLQPNLHNFVYIKMIKNHVPMNSSGGTITFHKDDVFFLPYE